MQCVRMVIYILAPRRVIFNDNIFIIPKHFFDMAHFAPGRCMKFLSILHMYTDMLPAFTITDDAQEPATAS